MSSKHTVFLNYRESLKLLGKSRFKFFWAYFFCRKNTVEPFVLPWVVEK